MPRYDPHAIEPKWQRGWERDKTFHAVERPGVPKVYVLDMVPYPSGEGLHVGHPEGYTATDMWSRYKRMRGFNVLHPMGYDGSLTRSLSTASWVTWVLSCRNPINGRSSCSRIVDPKSKLVMVNTAVHRQPIDLPPLRETGALWTAVVSQLGD